MFRPIRPSLRPGAGICYRGAAGLRNNGTEQQIGTDDSRRGDVTVAIADHGAAVPVWGHRAGRRPCRSLVVAEVKPPAEAQRAAERKDS
ncbi:hypothetical protein GCM10010236_28140 [Streptomyces eurythermus]|nr:hypothetical protein GCM10010236_28140 [Streptomyces eurythermus]